MYRILQIEAWADCCGCECEEGKPTCWTWNNWFHVGDVEQVPNSLEEMLKALDAKKGIDPSQYDLEDDQYNVVLVNKESREPLFAIEYGNK